MFADNQIPPHMQEDEDSVFGAVVQFAPTPEGFTDLQSRFVDAFIQLGGRPEKAAIAAGYAEGGAQNIGLRNLANPKINDEIVRRLKLQTGYALAVAFGAVIRVIQTSSDDKAVISAAFGLADRFGMAPPKAGVTVNVDARTINASGAQSILQELWDARNKRIASEQGADVSAIPLAMADTKQRTIEHVEQPKPLDPTWPAATPAGGGMFD